MKTIYSAFRELAARDPGRLAIATARGGGRYDEISLGDLAREADTLAGIFAHHGIAEGMRTSVMFRPGRLFCASVFALLKIGAIPVFIGSGIGWRHIGNCMREAKPAAFIGSTKAHIVRRVLGWGRETVRINVTVGEKGTDKTNDSARIASPRISPDTTAAIVFTSGSTGSPKGVVFDQENLWSQAEAVRDLLGTHAEDPHLTTFSLFLLFAPVVGFPAILPNMDMSKPAEADPAELSKAIDDYGCRSCFAAPVIVERLGRYCLENKRRLPALRRMLSGGAPSRSDALATLAAALDPGAEMLTAYGSTEALSVATLNVREIFEDAGAKTAGGAGVCIGRALPGMQAAIIPITDEAFANWSETPKLAPGEIGEIAVSGGVVSREYLDNPTADRYSKIPCAESGAFYHRMGDLGYIDDVGRIWMCGRKSHRVVTSKRVYFSVNCERIFDNHPEVARTALVAVPTKDDAIPVLCVELKAPKAKAGAAAKQKISNELRARGAELEMTRLIQEILFHDSFPVDARHNSKIRREELAVWAARKLRRRYPF